MPQTDLSYVRLEGGQAAGHAGDLHALHAEVCADPPYSQPDDAAAFGHRLTVQSRQPGFVLARGHPRRLPRGRQGTVLSAVQS